MRIAMLPCNLCIKILSHSLDIYTIFIPIRTYQIKTYKTLQISSSTCTFKPLKPFKMHILHHPTTILSYAVDLKFQNVAQHNKNNNNSTDDDGFRLKNKIKRKETVKAGREVTTNGPGESCPRWKGLWQLSYLGRWASGAHRNLWGPILPSSSRLMETGLWRQRSPKEIQKGPQKGP